MAKWISLGECKATHITERKGVMGTGSKVRLKRETRATGAIFEQYVDRDTGNILLERLEAISLPDIEIE